MLVPVPVAARRWPISSGNGKRSSQRELNPPPSLPIVDAHLVRGRGYTRRPTGTGPEVADRTVRHPRARPGGGQSQSHAGAVAIKGQAVVGPRDIGGDVLCVAGPLLVGRIDRRRNAPLQLTEAPALGDSFEDGRVDVLEKLTKALEVLTGAIFPMRRDIQQVIERVELPDRGNP